MYQQQKLFDSNNSQTKADRIDALRLLLGSKEAQLRRAYFLRKYRRAAAIERGRKRAQHRDH